MIKKTPSKTGTTTKVTFEMPPLEAEQVNVVGDFNEWSPTSTPLARRKDGRFSATLTLPSGRAYRYRYLVDGSRRENDWAADSYVANEFGSEDSVVQV